MNIALRALLMSAIVGLPSGFAVPENPGRGNNPDLATDFDGDGKTDMTVYHPGSGVWMTLTSASSYVLITTRTYGGTGYTAVPGDYDGDGHADYAVYETATGNWSILLSTSGYRTELNANAGGPGWMPVPGDFDGDRRTDPAVYNGLTGQWLALKSGSNYTASVSALFGGGLAYRPITGEFDGDGKTDIGLYSAGDYSLRLSTSKYTAGFAVNDVAEDTGSVLAPADFDGDGKTDLVTYAAWFRWTGRVSSDNYMTLRHWWSRVLAHTPVRGDYDGDGMTDLVAYDPWIGRWRVSLSSAGYPDSYAEVMARTLGGRGYVALPAYP